jgi:hypothetical protein
MLSTEDLTDTLPEASERPPRTLSKAEVRVARLEIAEEMLALVVKDGLDDCRPDVGGNVELAQLCLEEA